MNRRAEPGQLESRSLEADESVTEVLEHFSAMRVPGAVKVNSNQLNEVGGEDITKTDAKDNRKDVIENNVSGMFLPALFKNNREDFTENDESEMFLPALFKNNRNDYIGHIILNYDEHNHIVRESWFRGKRKIREFLK